MTFIPSEKFPEPHVHRIVPVSMSRASDFVDQFHRHNVGIESGMTFSMGVVCQDKVVGVAIVGTPANYTLMDGWTSEIRRVCVLEGHPDANSMLYGACWKAARALGYHRLITYTLETESASSLKAVGWTVIKEFVRDWDTAWGPRSKSGRPEKYPGDGVTKFCWMVKTPEYDAIAVKRWGYVWPTAEVTDKNWIEQPMGGF